MNSRGGTEARSPAARALSALAVLVAAILLGWAVLKSTVATALAERDPRVAASVAPDRPDLVSALALEEFESEGGRLQERGYRRLLEAALAAPLDFTPPLIAGARALAGGDREAGQRLLEEARRRSPREEMPRLLLLNLYLADGRIGAATREIAVLTRILPQAGSLLVSELSRLARDPRTLPGLRRALSGETILDSVLLDLVRTGAEPELVLNLAGPQTGTGSGDKPEWQSALVRSLVAKGRIQDAQRLWKAFTPGAGEGAAIYDAGFRGLPGEPPFGWDLREDGVGAAELASPPGLEVEYFGRDNGELATQLLVLSPGQYRLAMRVEGNAKGEGSQLEWRLTCVDSADELARLPLKGIDYSPRVVSAQFVVPRNCRAQWLRLHGVGGEFPSAQFVRITGLDLARGGGG